MMKPIARFGFLVLALLLASSTALAATCPKANVTETYAITAGGAVCKITINNGTCSVSSCPDQSTCTTGSCSKTGSTCTSGSTCTTGTCPKTGVKSGSVTTTTGSTCPKITKKPAATEKPAATPKPTKKPTATKKPTETKAPASGSSLSAMASEVVRQTNAERAKQGLGALTVSSELTRAATVRAQEIVQKFSHTRPDGSAWSTVSSACRGENIAMGQQSADKVMAAWMSSSGHRANILRSSFGSIGVAAYKVGNTMYWVQEFGG
jgi:uncharacterized protein YkwD